MPEESIKPWELRDAYREGRNIMQMVRDSRHSQVNDERTIELSYDLQSGSYIRHVETPGGREQRRSFARHVIEVFNDLGAVGSLLEAGVGEAITLWHLLDQMKSAPLQVHGIDLCWSRVACGARWLERQAPRFEITLAAASLLELPYRDDSFDVVYTVHAIEPNREREAEILAELHRVAARHLVLLEPAYEFASAEARARMDQHGYCRGLADAARALGFHVRRHEMFAGSFTPLNPTGLLVIDKNPDAPSATPAFACPSYRTPMDRAADCFYSGESMRAYPVIGGIPCLRSSAGIIASKLGDLADDRL